MFMQMESPEPVAVDRVDDASKKNPELGDQRLELLVLGTAE